MMKSSLRGWRELYKQKIFIKINLKHTVAAKIKYYLILKFKIYFFLLVDRSYWLQSTLRMLDYGLEKLNDNLVMTD